MSVSGASPCGSSYPRWAIVRFLLAPAFAPCVCGAQETRLPPPAAAAAGYLQHTFSAPFVESDVDLSASPARSKSWYLWNFHHLSRTPGEIRLHGDGSASIAAKTVNEFNGQVTTAAAAADQQSGFVGTAFGGGGYFEATLAFDPEQVAAGNTAAGWPSFWTQPLEMVLNRGEAHWPGQPAGYNHYAELDILEYGYVLAHGARNTYGVDVHDFYGQAGKTCSNWLCDYELGRRLATAQVSPETDFKRFHRYAALWAPASSTSEGYLQHFFDDEPVGTKVTWKMLPADATPPPDGKDWAFSIFDKEKHLLVLGSSRVAPLQVERVDVWQKSDAENAKN